MSKNAIVLRGNLATEPELRETTTGYSVCNFVLATDDGYTKNGVRTERTNYHQIAVFGNWGEQVAKYKHKGDEVEVEGILVHRKVDRTAIKLVDGQTIQLPAAVRITYSQVNATKPVEFLRTAARNRVDAGKALPKQDAGSAPAGQDDFGDLWEQEAEARAAAAALADQGQ